MPRVSVIVPNYNHARYLRERMDSILAQTFTDFEIIYLDDASTDDSATVIAEYTGETRLAAVVNNPTNSGSPFAQWNRGVHLAQGDYIWLAEADDRAAPTFLERLVGILDTHPNVGIAYTQSRLIDSDSNPTGSAFDYNRNLGDDIGHWSQDFINTGKDEIARFLVRQNTLPNASAVLFRRSLFNKVGGAEEGFRLSGDYLLWIQILLISDLAFLAEPLNDFRRHSGSVRHGTYQDGTVLLECYQVQDFLRENLTISPTASDAALDDLMDRWIEHTVLAPGRLSPERYRAIRQWQRRVDPASEARLLRRLAQRATRFLYRRTGGFS